MISQTSTTETSDHPDPTPFAVYGVVNVNGMQGPMGTKVSILSTSWPLGAQVS